MGRTKHFQCVLQSSTQMGLEWVKNPPGHTILPFILKSHVTRCTCTGSDIMMMSLCPFLMLCNVIRTTWLPTHPYDVSVAHWHEKCKRWTGRWWWTMTHSCPVTQECVSTTCSATPSPTYLGASSQPEPSTALLILQIQGHEIDQLYLSYYLYTSFDVHRCCMIIG